jgi:hypothetical protein
MGEVCVGHRVIILCTGGIYYLYGAVNFRPKACMDGGGGEAGRLSSFMHLSSPSRAIKFLCAPALLAPIVWALKPPSWALHLLGLSLALICVCTRRYAGMYNIGLSMVFWASNGTRLSALCHFTGPKKLSISMAQPPPTCLPNRCCPHQKHYARAV